MILKELNLISFGKFQNKRLKLEDGLNIFYGKNESGKTTIHNFIEGMFYGFLKPYAKQRNYLKEHKKYRPWNGEEYRGILKFSKDGKLYRIERDFAKGEVKVYDDLTGGDITKDIDTGEKIKVHLPGIYFFGFNNAVYKNTISIKQLGNKIDSDLSKEVKDRLANISTSLDDDISVKNALAHLKKQLEDIGTERASTRPYGRSKLELNRLYDRRKQTLVKQEEYNRYLDESFVLKERIEAEKAILRELQTKLEKIHLLEKRKTYEEGLSINRELERIELEIENLKDYSNLSFDEYTKALQLYGDNKHISKEIQELKDILDNIEKLLDNIKVETGEEIKKGIRMEELYEDMASYDEMEDKKNNLILNSEKNRLEILNSELKGKVEKDNRLKISMTILILLTIGSLGFVFINTFLVLLGIPLVITSIYIESRRKESNMEIDNLKQIIQDIKSKEDESKERIIHMENSQKAILLKYNCSSKLELKRLYDDIYLNYMDKSNRINKINELAQKKEKIILNLNLKEKALKKLKDQFDQIIIKNNSNTLEEFKEGLEKKKTYESLIKDKDNKIQVLERILRKNSLDELKWELTVYDDRYFEDIKDMDKDEIIDEIEKREEILFSMKDSNARLEERIDNLNIEVKQLLMMEERIDRIEKRIEGYDNKIKSIEIAKETIEDISREIHNQFAPSINKEVSQVIKLLTDGKYDQVKIDDSLDISVENPITKEIIDIDSLSGGTIDQLYFALRFSIISSIKGEGLPLVLDDCFIQYDDERLRNILGFLSNMSDEKQILLFTCHHREKEILDNLDLKYNLINLA